MRHHASPGSLPGEPLALCTPFLATDPPCHGVLSRDRQDMWHWTTDDLLVVDAQPCEFDSEYIWLPPDKREATEDEYHTEFPQEARFSLRDRGPDTKDLGHGWEESVHWVPSSRHACVHHH